MDYEIQEISPDDLYIYVKVPIYFEVSSVLEVNLIDDGLGGIELIEKDLENTYIKDYDEYGESEILQLENKFELSNWTFFLVKDNDKPVGGVTVVYDTDTVNMLAGRKDMSLVWDIRVHPDYRREGIGEKLFKKAIEWSNEMGCKQLKVETQNINVPACKFYRAQGCKLGEINRYAYADIDRLSNEIMLVWYLKL